MSKSSTSYAYILYSFKSLSRTLGTSLLLTFLMFSDLFNLCKRVPYEIFCNRSSTIFHIARIKNVPPVLTTKFGIFVSSWDCSSNEIINSFRQILLLVGRKLCRIITKLK